MTHRESPPNKNTEILELLAGTEADSPVSLRDLLSGPMDIRLFLELATALAQCLAGIHGDKTTCFSIRPDNITIDPASGQVAFECGAGRQNRILSLAYISPEQTGRMNRITDYRTDLYSLGVCLYEMLSGQLPFPPGEPTELVYAHIARIPSSLSEISSSIPRALSDIVEKLLAKAAEDRYQTAAGLAADLKFCLDQYVVRGLIPRFELGRHDISEQLLFPQKLYGRDYEKGVLMDSFHNMLGNGRMEMVFVSGYSGIGKSSLIREMTEPVGREGGIFIAGKFEQYRSVVPYSCIAGAFKEYLQQILAGDENTISAWRGTFLRAMGINAGLIVDVIPYVGLITGPLPPVPEMPAAESQNRFNMVFKQFVQAFATREHPLVIFLDDLQWIDPPSLRLLDSLAGQEDIGHLLFIGSFRDNEVNQSHPLAMLLEQWQRTRMLFKVISLPPLAYEHIYQFIIDTLHSTAAETRPLASLIYEKTGGNPFFTIQFMKTMYEEGVIHFDRVHGGWLWDLGQIESQGYADNVVEMMLNRLRRLDENTQTIIKLAACIGNSFDLETVAIIAECDDEAVRFALEPAVHEGLLIFAGADQMFFAHDRIQQAAYSLMPRDEQARLHLRIGRLLLARSGEGELERRIFQICHQLNMGLELIDDPDEALELVRLNYKAGQKAMSSTAYEQAGQFVECGLALLDEEAWDEQYNLILALHNMAVEASYLTGKPDIMQNSTLAVLSHALHPADKAGVYEIQILSLIAQGRLEEAIQAGLEILNLLGLELPEKPDPAMVRKELDTLRNGTLSCWTGDSIGELVNLPLMTDPVGLAKMTILNALISPTFIFSPELMALVGFQMVDLSVNLGNCQASPFGYTSFGLFLCAVPGDVEDGYRFGQMAVLLLSHLDAGKFKARTIYMFNGFIRHLMDHIRDTIPGMLEASTICMQTGDFEYAARALTLSARYYFLMGEKLARVEEIMASHNRICRQLQQMTSIVYLDIFQQTVANLKGQNDDPCTLKGEYFDSTSISEDAELISNRLAFFLTHFNQLLLRYLFEDYEGALESARLAAAEQSSSRGQYHFYEFVCYDSLARLAAYTGASPAERADIMNHVKDNQAMLQLWARYSPANHLHRWHLVEAEAARVLGYDQEAVHHYQNAINLSAEAQYVYEEALAWEKAGLWHMSQGRSSLGRVFLQVALQRYGQWGAEAKVAQMTQRHPFLGDVERNLAPALTEGDRAIAELDARSIARTSRAISSEIRLPDLVEILMNTVLEHAGAQKGALLIDSGEGLEVNALASMYNGSIHVWAPRETELDEDMLPATIINYVRRVRESLIVEDAVVHPFLADDLYVSNNRPRSVLCMPITRQNQLMGILYLENNLLSGAFTPDILMVLELIASQAAISIENAVLYANLQASESKFRAIFEQTFQLIGILNLDGILLQANSSAIALLSPQERQTVLGQYFWETPWWNHSPQLQSQLRDAIARARKGELVRFEAAHPAADGTMHYVDFSVKPVMDGEGRVVLLIPEGRDITERKYFEEALHASEEKYRTIFEHNGAATLMIEEDTTISLVNEEFASMFGYEPQEIEGKKSWTEFVDGKDRERMLNYHYRRRVPRDRAGQDEESENPPTKYEFTFVDKWGNRRHTLLTLTMIPGTRQSVAVIIDLTEQKKSEREIVRLQKLLGNIIDSMPSIIVTVDENGLIKQWNAGAVKNTGIQVNEALDQPVMKVLPMMAECRSQLSESMSSGQTQKIEKMSSVKEGRKAYWSVTISPLAELDNAGAVIRIDDISDKVRLDEIIIQTEKMMSVGGLAAGMAHEINNPLGGIVQGVQNVSRRFNADLLANRAIADEMGLDLRIVHEYMERRKIEEILEGIRTSGIRASAIVRNMLQFSRGSQTGHTRCSLHDILEKGLELASNDYDLKKKYDFRYISIEREYVPETLEVMCAEAEIEQVVLNLLKNAAQAVHSVSLPGFVPRIIVRTYTEGNDAVFEIGDNGPGMSESVKRRIFEPFFTTKPAGEGTGLGLSVSYFIVTRNHRGQMSVDSSPGQGALFIVRLPLAEDRTDEERRVIL